MLPRNAFERASDAAKKSGTGVASAVSIQDETSVVRPVRRRLRIRRNQQRLLLSKGRIEATAPLSLAIEPRHMSRNTEAAGAASN